MTNDEALQEMMIKEPFDDGAKIQFSVPDVPYSAITFGLNDNPEVAMWWADQWRLAYLKRFDEGVATNEEAPAPVIEKAPEVQAPSGPVDENIDKHFDGQPMYIVKSKEGEVFPACPVHMFKGGTVRFKFHSYAEHAEKERNGESNMLWKFTNLGLAEDTYWCTQNVDGKWCDRFVGAADFKAKHVAF